MSEASKLVEIRVELLAEQPGPHLVDLKGHLPQELPVPVVAGGRRAVEVHGHAAQEPFHSGVEVLEVEGHSGDVHHVRAGRTYAVYGRHESFMHGANRFAVLAEACEKEP